MKIIDGNITTPKGFKATGGAVGIKKSGNDLALINSEVAAVTAAVFTTNEVKASSVTRNIAVLKENTTTFGVAINSGNANACTGDEGDAANALMAKTFADLIKCNENEVLTASTGVIGVLLPIETVTNGIKKLYPSLDAKKESADLAAKSIMTTDTFKKEVCIQLEIDGKTVTIAGIAKGSGMIHPNMATMLGFITTDVSISKKMLQRALDKDVKLTYNMVSVDGDTSTNDTVIVMANGLADNCLIDSEGEDFDKFCKALHMVNEKLAKDLVKDGEGATKLIEVNVSGAKSDESAQVIAKSVITSSLVKAAMFGEDANWGRVLCAMGYSGEKFDISKVIIKYRSAGGEIVLMDNGTPIVFDEDVALKILKENEIFVDVTLADGFGFGTAWGCDLSYDYVKINGDYRS